MNLIQANGKIQVDKYTHEDRIAGFYLGQFGEEVLTDKDREIMQRWNQVWAMANNFYSPWQAIRMHMKKCEADGAPISRSTAFNDWRNATRVFGNVVKTTKDAKRALYEEMGMKAYIMALNSRDIDNMNKAISNLIKIGAIDRDTIEDHDKGGNTLFVMNVYTKDAQKPKIINLDDIAGIDKNTRQEVLDAIESEEVTEVEMDKLIDDASPEPE